MLSYDTCNRPLLWQGTWLMDGDDLRKESNTFPFCEDFCIVMPRGGATACGSSFVCLFVIMPRAELPRHTVIVLSVSLSLCLLQAFIIAHWKLNAETSYTSRTRYLLGSELKKFGSKASFASYGVICLPWLPLLTIWTYLKTKLPTIDCLAAHRFDLCYRIAVASPEKSYQKAYSYLTRVLI